MKKDAQTKIISEIFLQKILLQKILLLLLLVGAFFSSAQAQVSVQSSLSYPKSISPGNEVTLELILENVGEGDIENVVITLDLGQVPFVPVESTTEKVIGEIEENDLETVSFIVKALPDAEPSVYKIPVIITYNNISRTSFMSVEIEGTPALDVLVESSEIVQVDEKGKVTLKFVNNGVAQARLLKVTLLESPHYEIISPSSLYVGEVDVGDFETEDFTLIAKSGNPILVFHLEYSDSQNHFFSEAKLVKLVVYNKEKAQELGLVKEKGISPLIAVLVVIVFFGAWRYRKRSRRNKKNDS